MNNFSCTLCLYSRERLLFGLFSAKSEYFGSLDRSSEFFIEINRAIHIVYEYCNYNSKIKWPYERNDRCSHWFPIYSKNITQNSIAPCRIWTTERLCWSAERVMGSRNTYCFHIDQQHWVLQYEFTGSSSLRNAIMKIKQPMNSSLIVMLNIKFLYAL